MPFKTPASRKAFFARLESIIAKSPFEAYPLPKPPGGRASNKQVRQWLMKAIKHRKKENKR